MNVDRLAAWASATVVTVAVVAGLVVSGLPAEERRQRLDERRVNDLRTLSRVVDDYWSDRAELPATLAELVDGRRLSELPTDPVTGQPYSYRLLGERRYRLCARFARPGPPDPGDDFWRHPAGEHCYEFEVVASAGTRRR